MKINQMKKMNFSRDFISLNQQSSEKQEQEKITLPLPFKMIVEKFLVIFGMLSLIMLKNLLLGKLSL